MTKHKKQEKLTEPATSNLSQPVFTGDFIHDGSVSESEKAAEVSLTLFNAIKKRKARRNSKR